MALFCRIISLENAAEFPIFCRTLSEALLRVPDALTQNLLVEMIEWDDEEAHKNKVSNPKAIGQHLQEAVKTINKCGVTFHVWEKKNADGKGSSTYDWTSQMGNKKMLLKTFPGYFSTLLQKEIAKTVEKISKVRISLFQECKLLKLKNLLLLTASFNKFGYICFK